MNIIAMKSTFLSFESKKPKAREKGIDNPRYPRYSVGGWNANKMSCRIGLSPSPSAGGLFNRSKGLETRTK